MTDEKEVVLHPRSRVRVETLRGLLLGMKALIENGCEIKSVSIRAMAAAGKARQQTIGRRRKKDAEQGARVVERKKGKPGRPRKHRKKKGETEADMQRRLARKRSQDYRDRKKKGTKP